MRLDSKTLTGITTHSVIMRPRVKERQREIAMRWGLVKQRETRTQTDLGRQRGITKR